jgi:sulfite exporter TauE/SafE
MIGNTSELAGSYAARGAGFGFVFAAIAGLAATFTACNCVVFAMLPGLACSTDGSGRAISPWRALGAFVAGVVVVCAAYGAYVGLLGPERIEAFNARPVRLAQAQTTFTLIGLIMLAWGTSELGFLDTLKARLSPTVRRFLHASTTKAALIGILVGLFAVGRPFPVFREFLTYAASAQNPLYGSAVMTVQGIGQIVVMIALFAVMVLLGGRRLMRWATERPHQPRLMSGLALLAGGAFFVFYWGLAFAYDVGRWGFKLGWYG